MQYKLTKKRYLGNINRSRIKSYFSVKLCEIQKQIRKIKYLLKKNVWLFILKIFPCKYVLQSNQTKICIKKPKLYFLAKHIMHKKMFIPKWNILLKKILQSWFRLLSYATHVFPFDLKNAIKSFKNFPLPTKIYAWWKNNNRESCSTVKILQIYFW